jgi:xanthine dehydrogenase accessory factor
MQLNLDSAWGSELCLSECLGIVGQSPLVLIQVMQTKGSAPREAGAWMLVTNQLVLNTIGGGHLEYESINIARSLLRDLPGGSGLVPQSMEREFKLGPSLGQCCGGAMRLMFTVLPEAPDRGRWLAQRLDDPAGSLSPVALIGGGHVGQAIVRALLPLPFSLTWIDSRDGVFPQISHPRLTISPADDVIDGVAQVDPKSSLLVMSFTHAEDFEVIRAALLRRREDSGCFPFIGLIGSKTKWAKFRHRLLGRGLSERELEAVTCPIGLTEIVGKSPAVIAASAAAQLLVHRSRNSRFQG